MGPEAERVRREWRRGGREGGSERARRGVWWRRGGGCVCVCEEGGECPCAHEKKEVWGLLSPVLASVRRGQRDRQRDKTDGLPVFGCGRADHVRSARSITVIIIIHAG